jgi:hypothetical protein
VKFNCDVGTYTPTTVVDSATVGCSDVGLQGRPINGGATCGTGNALVSFYPVHGSGGSLPTDFTAICASDTPDSLSSLTSISLTCCVFDDSYAGSYSGN